MSEDHQSDEEMDRIYKFIGNYIVLFQIIESYLDECIRYLSETDFHIHQSIVSKLNNRDKIELIRTMISSKQLRNSDQYFDDISLKKHLKTLKECSEEAACRNRIVHSFYLFEPLEFGEPAIRTKIKFQKHKLVGDNETLDDQAMAEHLSRIAKLSLKAHLLKMRCFHHWCETPIKISDWSDDTMRAILDS